MALVQFDTDKSHKSCSVLLGNNWRSMPVTSHNLEATAVHELMHILLYDLIEYARTHPEDESGILEKEHEVVNRIEQIVIGLPVHKK
jgi:hypothetical protein